MFVDTVTLTLLAGRGGDGVISWRREKYIPKGGPAGGDGGKGGSLYLQADSQIPSLEDYRNARIIKAKNGMPGGSNCCKGKDGADIYLKVPLGTLVKDAQTGEILFDFTQDKELYKICAGGIGGKGNTHFKTATRQAPFICTEGTLGDEREVELELKLIADVGFVGMPNAGKSTLISSLARVKVKIAPYPFTTLRPNLGLLEFDDYSRILIADIPGIIEKAHENKGLGLSFLKHIERTRVLCYLIELSPDELRDPYTEFTMLQQELYSYNPDLLKKPFLVLLNKMDQEGTEPLIKAFQEQYPFPPSTLFTISAKEKQGLEPFKAELHNLCCIKRTTLAAY